MDYKLFNKTIQLTVTDEGGTMKSIIYLPSGEERQWQGDEYWKSQDVVIFPIIGHAGAFTVNGKTCNLKSHGIVRYSKLLVEDKSDTSITMSLKSDEQTRENYPYDFIFKIRYDLIESGIKVSYFVQSLGCSMPFYVGGHPGMYAPGGSTVIEFENEENPTIYPIDCDGGVKLNALKRFVADKQFFAECKTLQLGGLSGGSIYAHTQDGYTYEYKSDCPLFAFWSNLGGA
jgi:galactose mutarotase-like enzyme